ncbi:hypothetical protein F5Y04DRAFT_140134 [Hypomontagnella monticulosa]|nr:hypothetical protein F5Y04DRAFT_140134 [Hypomontagnella monticulosa]
MVNGLERLERFFGSSRRRDKEREARNRELSTVSSPTQDGPYFPSPSFMHPTSTHMKPREESAPWSKAAKDRSLSLPDPKSHIRRRSSVGSASPTLNHRHYPSDPVRPISLSIKQAEGHLTIQKLSRFRFPQYPPEDRNPGSPSTDAIGTESAHEPTGQEYQENILDWCPRRLSSLFNNLGLDTSIDDRLASLSEDDAELLALQPSPISSSPPSPKTRIDHIVIPPRRSSQNPSDIPAQHFTKVAAGNPHYAFPTATPDSPPESDGEDEAPHTPFRRSTTVKALASPIKFMPRVSSDSEARNNLRDSTCKHPARESWGAKSQDPVLAFTTPDESVFIPQSRLVRKSVSIASLSTVTRYSSVDYEIREPSLDDFYALNDEDVAESLPPILKPEADIPPTPPPKDPPQTPIGRSRSTRHAPIAPTTEINSLSGQLTPPRTPTDSQFLALTYTPTNASGASGAMWAASIAGAYNFDLVYVISLWPKGGRGNPNSSRRSSSTSRQHGEQDANTPNSQDAVVGNPKSGMTGRLLAAYGLNEFGSPFRVHTQFHTNMLGFKGWKEYRDELASPGMISRGWTCSFQNDYIPTAPSKTGGEHLARGETANHGIVFAAYTRKTTKSVIPVNPSPKQAVILGKLLYDAQTLVNALVHGA